jgi:DivIVA domain-containing protein
MADEGDPQDTPAPRQRRRSEADTIRAKQFPPAMRGYDRHSVDEWREHVARLVERLEDAAPRDAAVRRALDEVGAETAAILQRAHEAADDITSRSRSQAEGRLTRAEREAEITVSEAEARVRELDADYRRVWDERARLLDEMRQLADDVLGVADDASERIDGPREPEPITAETEAVGDEETDTTSDEPGEEEPVEDEPAPVSDEEPTVVSPRSSETG